jgi:AcrR family transcriptional regulator
MSRRAPSTSDSGAARPTRVRRSPEAARATILTASEELLVADGPDAVRVQRVAAMVGMTDAAVHYHFRTRDDLLTALLSAIAKRLKDDVASVASQWDSDRIELAELVELLDDRYRSRNYARMTAWMHLSGWQPRGSGIFRAQAEVLHESRQRLARAAGRPAPELEDSLHLIVLVNLVAWADALVGNAWRRGVGLPATRQNASTFRRWFVALVEGHLDRDLTA